ncbi:MAG: RraA family protein [Comamonas sp.]|uniref:RraA family protein n=1 Tax=Comamonas sp. TaxID=34028 RepID=UPI002FC74AD0
MNANFTINPAPQAPDAALLKAFEDVPTSHISDNLGRLEGIVGLRRFHRSRKLLGTAVTVKARPGDNLLTYKALSMMSPGQVLVVDAGGATNNAVVGDLLLEYALQRGCTGFVIDGAIRDCAAFLAADFPCYARDVNHCGPFKTGPGAVNVAVSIGGQVVQPGDFLLGDEDGIVVFPADRAGELLAAALRHAQLEQEIRAEIRTGKVQQSWMDKMFAPHGL